MPPSPPTFPPRPSDLHSQFLAWKQVSGFWMPLMAGNQFIWPTSTNLLPWMKPATLVRVTLQDCNREARMKCLHERIRAGRDIMGA